MPFTPAQVRLFLAAAHDKGIAKRSGIKRKDAAKLAREAGPKARSSAMRGRRTVLD